MHCTHKKRLSRTEFLLCLLRTRPRGELVIQLGQTKSGIDRRLVSQVLLFLILLHSLTSTTTYNMSANDYYNAGKGQENNGGYYPPQGMSTHFQQVGV